METARRRIDGLKQLGIDLSAVTDRLQVEGVADFVKPFKALMESIETKRRQLAAG
jgi:transaldolase/transaldolase/glucose-6-phosphate isomerase